MLYLSIAVSKKPMPTPAATSAGSATKEDKMQQLESLLSKCYLYQSILYLSVLQLLILYLA